MRVWHWHSKPNFGDALGPAILERLGRKVERVQNKNHADIITVGSILGMGPFPKGTMVWGSGHIKEPTVVAGKDWYQYLAVRGELTRDIEGLPENIPLGDPGILVSRLWPKPAGRRGLGVVPHYVDERKFTFADKVIDVRGDLDTVIKEIASCDRILSSSLHGLIVAQSFGIPAMRLYHDKVIGGDFKWADYLSGLREPLWQTQEKLLKALPG